MTLHENAIRDSGLYIGPKCISSIGILYRYTSLYAGYVGYVGYVRYLLVPQISLLHEIETPAQVCYIYFNSPQLANTNWL